MKPDWSSTGGSNGGIVAAMVTRIHKGLKRRLFLREHRKDRGVSAKEMAGRLGIERESVYRCEREQHRLTPQDQVNWAHALGLEPEDLWRPPGPPSLDSIVRNQPEDVQGMAADIVQRLVARRG